MNSFISMRVRGAEAEAAAVAPFEEIRKPLADRPSRIFPGENGRPGTTYESHEITLARGRLTAGLPNGSGYVIIMRNGSGVSVLHLPTFYDGGAMVAAFLAMPEPVLYATLYTMWRAADDAWTEAEKRTRNTWAQAYVDKRIKARRKGGRAMVEVLPLYQASASYTGQPPVSVPGSFRTPDEAFAAAKAAHPGAASVSAAPIQ